MLMILGMLYTHENGTLLWVVEAGSGPDGYVKARIVNERLEGDQYAQYSGPGWDKQARDGLITRGIRVARNGKVRFAERVLPPEHVHGRLRRSEKQDHVMWRDSLLQPDRHSITLPGWRRWARENPGRRRQSPRETPYENTQ